MLTLRYFLAILVVAFFVKCQNKETTPLQSDNDLVISLANGKVTSNLNPNELANFAERVLLSSGDANPLLKKGKVLESHLEMDGDYYHVISQFKNEKTGEIINTALELKREPTTEGKAGLRVSANEEDGTVSTNGVPLEKHTCAGNPCSGCEFVKGTGGRIIGCNCKYSSGQGSKCDHTVSQ